MNKKYSSVKDMLAEDPELLAEFEGLQEKRQITKELVMMRVKAGITQEELAKMFEHPVRYIHNIEEGLDRYLTIATIGAYCVACHDSINISLSDNSK